MATNVLVVGRRIEEEFLSSVFFFAAHDGSVGRVLICALCSAFEVTLMETVRVGYELALETGWR